MARYNLTRVIFVLAVTLSVVAQAGWFGGEEQEEKPERQRRRRDYQNTVEDTVEYDPSYGQRGGGRRDEQQPDPRERERESVRRGNGSDARREQLREMRKGKKARDRDEMTSDSYQQEVMRDEQIEETHTPEENLDGYLTDDDINKIWAEHMHDFVPEDMSNVIVENKSTEALFEYIGHEEPTKVKGAYYVLGGNQDKTVSCIVYDPNREIIYKRKGSAQGILIFDTTMPGEYAIIFSNMASGQDLTVTLALHTYEEKTEEIKYDITEDGERIVVEQRTEDDVKMEVLGGEENHAATEEEIGGVRSMLREIQVQIKQMQSEAKLSMMRQDGHNADLLENQDWNFYFMLIEVGCFMAILAFQTTHIKKLLDNKLIL